MRLDMTLHYYSMMLVATTEDEGTDPRGRERGEVEPTDEEFRIKLREVLALSSISMRRLSAAMGRDPGYIAALLDPSRPSRARPTPADLLRASDATAIPFVGLLEVLWNIDPGRLADELTRLGVRDLRASRKGDLTDVEWANVADYVAFLAARHKGERDRG
jgi:hypothetical protein